MDSKTFHKLADQYKLGHVAQSIYDVSKNCVRIKKTQLTDQSLPVGASKIGGNPDVPNDFEWPYWRNSFLAFLLQINLSELQTAQRFDDLPESGVIAFFFEYNHESKWFDPEDRESYQVYFFDSAELLVRTKSPEHPKHEFSYKSAGIEFEVRCCFPHPFSDSLDQVGMTDLELEGAYWEFFEEQLRFADPKHQLFGHPFLYQSDDMDVTCQLVSNGIYTGDSKAYRDPRLAELRQGAKEWRFFLQIDSDEDTNTQCTTFRRLLNRPNATGGDPVAD